MRSNTCRIIFDSFETPDEKINGISNLEKVAQLMTDSIHILHVDDDKDFAEMAAEFLERDDDRFTVATTTSTSDGLERLARDDFDCIISDYEMPDQNGIKFLKTVRDMYPQLPFILFTGKGSEEVASEAISAGVSDYLQKESGTDQYTVLANRIINLVTQYRAEIQVEQLTKLREESEEYRNRLLEIALDQDRSSQETIHDLLTLGCERFGVENGHLVIIDQEQERHNVISVVGSDIVQEGVSDLSNTYCRTTIASESHQEIYNAVDQGWENDPAYQTYGLGCYLGSKLTVGDRLVGTVCFVDEDPRDPFTHHERAFFDMVARWLNQMLEHRQLKQAKTIFENTQDALFVVDVTDESAFTIQRVNPAYEQLTGLRSKDLHGYTPREILGDEQGAEVEARYQECIAQGKPIEYEEQLNVGGTTKWWHTKLAPVIEKGDVTQLIGATRDITDRKERERRLHEEQQFVQSIFRSLPDPLYAFDTDGYPIRWNDQLEAVTGYSADEIEDMHVTEFVPEDEIDTITTNFQTILKEERTVTVESAFETKGGTRVPFEFTGGPLKALNGALRGATGVGRDITDRKQREEELERVRDRMTFALERTNAVIWEHDPDTGRLTTYPDSWPLLENTVETREDFIETVHPNDREAVSDAVETVTETGEPTQVEYRTNDGVETEWLAAQIEPVTEDGESVDQLVGLTRDITDQKQREQVLERQNERFDELASAVSHDLQTPLSTARGRAELAIETGDTEQMEKSLDALERADQLREDLVNVLRTREIVGETESVELGNEAKEVWKSTTASDEASLQIEDPVTIDGDLNAVRRLLENLFSNSIEHGREDVTVRLGRIDDGFYIEDDGPGIPEDERDDVFRPGYSTKQGGTGIGMVSVREIALAHEWKISVAESKNGGARFEIHTGMTNDESSSCSNKE